MELIAWRLHVVCVSSVCVPGTALAAGPNSVAAIWRAGAYLPAGLHIFGVGAVCCSLYSDGVVYMLLNGLVRGRVRGTWVNGYIMRLFLMALR